MALDAQGNVYVADSGNNRIQKLSPNGQPLQQWGIYGAESGQFSRPAGVAVDAQGNMYVVDEGNNRIQKLATDGQPLAQWGTSRDSSSGAESASQLTFADPTSIVLDRGGICSSSTPGPTALSRSHRPEPNLPSGASGALHPASSSCRWIGLDPQGNMIVADHDNDRIQKLSPDGKPLTQWGSERTPTQQFRQPTGLAVDAQGNTYVVDKNNERIQKLSTTGEHVAQWGSVGDKPGQFSSPIGIAIDGQGNVVVADSGNERVQRFGLDGRLLAYWSGHGDGPGQIKHPFRHCDGSTGQCVRDRHRHRPGADIHVVRSAGQTVGQNGQGPRRILDPLGIAVADDGSVYVADQGNARIQKP